MSKNKKFKPCKVQCSKCGDVFQSEYSGHFVSCLCGKSFIDQTTHYSRHGGYVTLYVEPKKENEEENSEEMG